MSTIKEVEKVKMLFEEADLVTALKREDWHWTVNQIVMKESIVRRLVKLHQTAVLDTVVDLGYKDMLLKALTEEESVAFCRRWLEELYLRDKNDVQKLLILKTLNRAN